MHQRFLSCFTSFGFKRLLGSTAVAGNGGFLEAITGTISPKTVLPVKTSEVWTRAQDEGSLLDLLCTDHKGEKAVVEIRKANHPWYRSQVDLLESFPATNNSPATAVAPTPEVYVIGLLNYAFDLDLRCEGGKHAVVLDMTDAYAERDFCSRMKFVYVELPRFNKTADELETQVEKWLFAIKNLPQFESRPGVLQGPAFDKLFELAEIAALDSDERRDYEQSLKQYRDLNNVIATAREEALSRSTSAMHPSRVTDSSPRYSTTSR